jgi:hypothetical protein
MQSCSESLTTDISRWPPGLENVGIRAVSRPPVHLAIGVDIEMTRCLLREGRARTLVIGTGRASGRAVRALRADFQAPVHHVRASGHLTLPEKQGTLLIHDVSRLGVADQVRLLGWLNLSRRGMSVIAVTSQPLFPLVQCGRFLSDLFYRLNLIVIDVTDFSCQPLVS